MIDSRPSNEMVLGPSPDALRGTLRSRLTPVGITLVATSLAIKFLVVAKYLSPNDSSAIPLYIGAIGATLIFAGIWQTLYLRNASLVLGNGRVTYRGRFRFSKSVPIKRVAGIALRAVRFPYTQNPINMYVLYAHDKHTLLTLPGSYWDLRDIESLSHKLGRGRPGHALRVTAADLEREFPDALTFVQRNNVLVGMLIPIAAIALGIILFGRSR